MNTIGNPLFLLSVGSDIYFLLQKYSKNVNICVKAFLMLKIEFSKICKNYLLHSPMFSLIIFSNNLLYPNKDNTKIFFLMR